MADLGVEIQILKRWVLEYLFKNHQGAHKKRDREGLRPMCRSTASQCSLSCFKRNSSQKRLYKAILWMDHSAFLAEGVWIRRKKMSDCQIITKVPTNKGTIAFKNWKTKISIISFLISLRTVYDKYISNQFSKKS